jgi:hypothetical protein
MPTSSLLIHVCYVFSFSILWPNFGIQLGELDQVAALVGGLLTLSFSVYDAYNRAEAGTLRLSRIFRPEVYASLRRRYR